MLITCRIWNPKTNTTLGSNLESGMEICLLQGLKDKVLPAGGFSACVERGHVDLWIAREIRFGP